MTNEFTEALDKLNSLLNLIGYNTYKVVDAEKQTVYLGEDADEVTTLSIKEMVEEAESYLAWYYDESTTYYELKADDLKQWRSETMKFRNFIKKYKDFKPAKPSRGGARPGAGRKPKGYKMVSIRMTDEEKIAVKKFLLEYRSKNK